MTSKQTMVMWLGILLILAKLFGTGQWKTIWTTVTTGPVSSSPTKPSVPLIPPPPLGGDIPLPLEIPLV